MQSFSFRHHLASVLALLTTALSAQTQTSPLSQHDLPMLQSATGSQGRFELMARDANRPQRLMGYTDEPVNSDRPLPPNMQTWLRQVERAAELVEMYPELQMGTTSTDASVVLPLLGDIKWDQSAPYSNYCPEGCPTGCVATAFAQVMYYYRQPEHGQGSHSYREHGRTHTVNYGEAAYDWDNMFDAVPRNLRPEQADAVALLSYHCGTSVDMSYDTEGSGAYTERIPMASSKYFGYKGKAYTIYRACYTYEQWDEIITQQLLAGRPVILSGTNEKVGHAFVVDGRNAEGKFHVNWGWSGYYNGYFDIGILNPDGAGIGGAVSDMGYCLNANAIIDLCPEETVSPDYCPIYAYWSAIERYGTVYARAGFQDCIGDTHTENIGIQLTNEAGEVCYRSHTQRCDFSGYPSYGAWQGVDIELSASQLPDGRYTMAFYRKADSGETVEIPCASHYSGNYIYVANHQIVELGNSIDHFTYEQKFSATNYSLASRDVLPADRKLDFAVDITNTQNNTFVGDFTLYKNRPNVELGNPIHTLSARLAPGEKIHFSAPLYFEADGQWEITFCALDYANSLFFDITPEGFKPYVTAEYNSESSAHLVLTTPLQLHNQRCELGDEVTFTFGADNTGGNFSDQLAIHLLTSKKSTTNPKLILPMEADIPMLTSGHEFTITGKLEGIKAMTRYYARPFFMHGDGTWHEITPASGTGTPVEVAVYNASGIEEIQADEATNVPTYDLMGRRTTSRQGIILRPSSLVISN